MSIALIVAAGAVVLLLVLIGLGYLVLPQNPTAPVTITQTRYTILEGKNASGGYWFGPSSLVYPGLNGYPTTVVPGAKFGVPIVMWNYDTANHTVYSISVASPFVYDKSDPGVPILILAGADNANFEFTLTAPNQPGTSAVVNITINALSAP